MTPRFEWRILSLHQPHASLFPLKAFETRGWPTKFRGPVIIHAAQTRAQMPLLKGDGVAAVRYRWALKQNGLEVAELPFGRIVGYGCLSESNQVTPLWLKGQNDNDLWFGDFALGRYAHRIEHFHRLVNPSLYRGPQGFPRIDPRTIFSETRIKNFESEIEHALGDAAGTLSLFSM